jgi:hypothetical protein
MYGFLRKNYLSHPAVINMIFAMRYIKVKCIREGNAYFLPIDIQGMMLLKGVCLLATAIADRGNFSGVLRISDARGKCMVGTAYDALKQ